MKKINGVIYAISSAVAFGFMPIFAMYAYIGGSNAITVVFLRFLFSAILLWGYFNIKKIDYKVSKELLIEVFIIGVIGYAATCVALYWAYEYIPVGVATILHFTYPLVVTFLSFFIFKEELHLKKIISLILSIIGLVILVGFSKVHFAFWGVFLALLSGILYSIYILAIGHSKIKKIDSLVLTFYVSIFSALSILPVALVTHTFIFEMNIEIFIAVLLLAIVCTLFALLAFLKSIKIIGASNASILSTFEPITSVILGVILFKEKLTLSIIVGSLLIISSVYIIAKESK